MSRGSSPSIQQPDPPRRRKRWPWVLAACAALAVLAWLRLSTPDECSLARYRTMAETQLPASRGAGDTRGVAVREDSVSARCAR